MKTQKAPLSIRIFYWIINFNLILLLAFFAAIVFNIFVYIGSFDDSITINVPFPVEVDFQEAGNLLLNNQNIEVRLVDASARLAISNAQPVFLS